MYYKVSEIAKMLDLSKVSIYNKVNTLQKELKPFTKKLKGVTTINEDGIEIIKKSFDIVNLHNADSVNHLKTDEKAFTGQSENTDSSEGDNELKGLTDGYVMLVDSLKEQVEYLKQQLSVKDQQIQGLTQGLHQAQALTNNQQQGQQSILLLEQHQEEFSNKLNGILEQMQEREAAAGQKKGLISKLFGK